MLQYQWAASAERIACKDQDNREELTSWARSAWGLPQAEFCRRTAEYPSPPSLQPHPHLKHLQRPLSDIGLSQSLPATCNASPIGYDLLS